MSTVMTRPDDFNVPYRYVSELRGMFSALATSPSRCVGEHALGRLKDLWQLEGGGHGERPQLVEGDPRLVGVADQALERHLDALGLGRLANRGLYRAHDRADAQAAGEHADDALRLTAELSHRLGDALNLRGAGPHRRRELAQAPDGGLDHALVALAVAQQSDAQILQAVGH
jgi:hypothetical protein